MPNPDGAGIGTARLFARLFDIFDLCLTGRLAECLCTAKPTRAKIPASTRMARAFRFNRRVAAYLPPAPRGNLMMRAIARCFGGGQDGALRYHHRD
jgi:hypothetical protein